MKESGQRAVFRHKTSDGRKEITKPMPNHTVAVKMVIDALTDSEYGCINLDEIGAVGHRIVHGGENFRMVIITEDTIKAIEECSDLAPLHNPANLIGKFLQRNHEGCTHGSSI